MAEPREIQVAVDLQLSPCGNKMEDATTIQGFNDILADFVSNAIEESDALPSGDFSVGGRIASQSILRQDGMWSQIGRFFRKFYTKRHSGDPVGRSRMEVKEILTLSFNNSTTNTVAASEEGLSKLIIDRFADENSTDQLRRQLLTSNGTNSFFSYPGPVKVVVIGKNRHAGIKLVPLLGSIGVVVLVLAFVIRFSPRRWRTTGKKTSECTSHSSLPPPELIDISTDLSSIGVHSPASVFHASREVKGRRTSEPAARMQQELPPIPEEQDYDLERGLPNMHYPERPTRSQAYPPSHAAPQDLKAIAVVVGAGYPEELGFTIWPGPEALEIKEVLGDSRLPLRAGDMIVEVDGQDASRWKPVDFEEYLVERRRHHKTLLIARPNRIPSRGRSGRDDDFDETYEDETPSYITERYETDCEDMLSRFDEVMFDDPTYHE